jgi:hypothetical protein
MSVGANSLAIEVTKGAVASVAIAVVSIVPWMTHQVVVEALSTRHCISIPGLSLQLGEPSGHLLMMLLESSRLLGIVIGKW